MAHNLKRIVGNPDMAEPVANQNADLEHEWTLVVFQPGVPVLEGELNLAQQHLYRSLRKAMEGVLSKKGGLLTILNPEPTGQPNEIRLMPEGTPYFLVSVEGLVKAVGAFDNPQTASNRTRYGNRVKLPTYAGGTQRDIVWLQLWHEEVQAENPNATASSVILDYGMDGAGSHTNNIRVESVGLEETTRRVQLRGKIVTTTSSNASDPDPMAGAVLPTAPGDGSRPWTAVDWYFVSGDGTTASAEALGTVDGYVYLLPLVWVRRTSAIPQAGQIGVIARESPLVRVGERLTALENFRDGIDTDSDGVVDLARNAQAVPWSGVTDKPQTFPPDPHTHPEIGQLTNRVNTLESRVDSNLAIINDTLNNHESRISMLESTTAFEIVYLEIGNDPGFVEGSGYGDLANRTTRLGEFTVPTRFAGRNVLFIVSSILIKAQTYGNGHLYLRRGGAPPPYPPTHFRKIHRYAAQTGGIPACYSGAAVMQVTGGETMFVEITASNYGGIGDLDPQTFTVTMVAL